MKLILILFLLVVVALAGLYVYGQVLEPETSVIEVEALDVER